MVRFSDLLRHPSETTERLNRARAVRLHRRDAADLVLMYAERADAEAELVEVASQLLAQLVRVSPDLVSRVLPLVLPWVRFLPAADVAALVAEFVSTAEAAAAGSPVSRTECWLRLCIRMSRRQGVAGVRRRPSPGAEPAARCPAGVGGPPDQLPFAKYAVSDILDAC